MASEESMHGQLGEYEWSVTKVCMVSDWSITCCSMCGSMCSTKHHWSRFAHFPGMFTLP